MGIQLFLFIAFVICQFFYNQLNELYKIFSINEGKSEFPARRILRINVIMMIVFASFMVIGMLIFYSGKYGNIFRAKGQLPAGSCWFQFDVADSRYGITGCEPLKTGKAVFIGTDIQRQPIRHVALNKMIQKKITWKKG